MIIWKGLGFLVAILGFGALLLTEYTVESVTGDENFYQRNSWVILAGMLFAALLTFVLHLLLSLKKPRIVIDRETGQEIEIRGDHSLFFIPVKWWPLVFVILGILFFFNDGAGIEDDVEAPAPATPASEPGD